MSKLMRAFFVAVTLSGFLLTSPARAALAVSTPSTVMIDGEDSVSIRDLYKTLIDKENHHDLHAVSDLLWDSPSTLFVAKTATQAEGGWAGFWSKDTVALHFSELFKGAFRIDPDYASEKIVALSKDVAQTYVPVQITVGYAGQTPVPKPFLMILEWVRTPDGWRMATDIALPIPPAPKP